MQAVQNNDEKTRHTAHMKASGEKTQMALAQRAENEELVDPHTPVDSDEDQTWGTWNSNANSAKPPKHGKKPKRKSRPPQWRRDAVRNNDDCRECGTAGFGTLQKYRCVNTYCEANWKTWKKTAKGKAEAAEFAKSEKARIEKLEQQVREQAQNSASATPFQAQVDAFKFKQAKSPFSQDSAPLAPSAKWHNAPRNIDTKARSSTDPRPDFPLLENQSPEELAVTASAHDSEKPAMGNFDTREEYWEAFEKWSEMDKRITMM